jgi:drug/metabolite transporter (DMT)-like permease
VLGIALGLASSVSWGISDFLGGLSSRRISALSVLLVTQPVGLVLALGFALIAGGDPLTGTEALLAGLAGAVVIVALGSFYRAMALGSVSVVATIGALGVLVPVAGGLVRGEAPGALAMAGALVAIPGVVLAAREPDPEWRAAGRAAIGLAAIAALGFGAFFLLLDLASSGNEPAWTIVAARVGGVSTLAIVAAVARPSLRIPRELAPALVAIGFCDVLANGLFAAATGHGLLVLVAIASSLYGAVTVLLARIFLGERLARSQRAGIALAFAGLALIAAGS